MSWGRAEADQGPTFREEATTGPATARPRNTFRLLPGRVLRPDANRPPHGRAPPSPGSPPPRRETHASVAPVPRAAATPARDHSTQPPASGDPARCSRRLVDQARAEHPTSPTSRPTLESSRAPPRTAPPASPLAPTPSTPGGSRPSRSRTCPASAGQAAPIPAARTLPCPPPAHTLAPLTRTADSPPRRAPRPPRAQPPPQPRTALRRYALTIPAPPLTRPPLPAPRSSGQPAQPRQTTSTEPAFGRVFRTRPNPCEAPRVRFQTGGNGGGTEPSPPTAERVAREPTTRGRPAPADQERRAQAVHPTRRSATADGRPKTSLLQKGLAMGLRGAGLEDLTPFH